MMSLAARLFTPLSVAWVFVFTPGVVVARAPDALLQLVRTHCYDCHEGENAEAGLDIASLGTGLDQDEVLRKWVMIHDRIKSGEMPPPEYATLDVDESGSVLHATSLWLREHQMETHERFGRVRARRLTNLQLERTLHDLLGIDIPLADRLPEDPRTSGFTTVAAGQAMSHFQLERHLSVVDAALDEAFRRAFDEPDEWSRKLSARMIARRRARSRTREPEMIDGRAVTWSSRLIFYGRLPATTAREAGWYRFTIRASALKSPDDHGVWCTVRAGKCVSSAPMLSWVGAFEATDEPQEFTFEAWLNKGDLIEVRPGDGTLKMARFRGGQVGAGEGGPQDVPGVALDWVQVERFHQGPDNDAVRRYLLGELSPPRSGNWKQVRFAPKNAKQCSDELMSAFACRAFRRPVDDAELAPYIAMVHKAMDNGESFLAALRGGYRALLCSPRFLYFQEQPGPLDGHAIATRLSYMLWNSMPDDELFRLAKSGHLAKADVLCAQVDRMLGSERGQRFVKDFASQWLDLSLIDFTEPDRKLYPDFDIVVQNSMLAETHAFLQKMLDDDLSVGNLIDSEFSFLNSRLARFYGIDRVRGDAVREVALRPEDRRGGLLTQGAILKVTANGTTTSPVIRGVWVSERLLGQEIPPPPEGVPAVEPDIRGAKTIREMLAKHRADDSCASCHVKIDPPGFALENFDPAGQWREKYGRVQKGRRSRGAVVDSSYELPDGRSFQDLDEFKTLILTDRASLGQNVAEKLLTYGTGAPITFSDRPTVRELVDGAAASDYGFRSLLRAVITSPIFLTK